jgi:hypothetical protein
LSVAIECFATWKKLDTNSAAAERSVRHILLQFENWMKRKETRAEIAV